MRIDTPTQRLRLKVRREPYWVKLQDRGYLGFRRTDGGGTWVARWRDELGKHLYMALRPGLIAPEAAHDEAARLAREWFKNAAAGVTARRTVRQAADAYVEALRQRKSESAAKEAEGRIKRTILAKLGDRPLDRLTTAELETWLYGMVPAGLEAEATRAAKASANRNLITLKALLNHAWSRGMVLSNGPWRKLRAYKDTRRARDVFLNAEQRRKLLEKCSGTFRDLVEAALVTGARYGELRQLTAGDFDRRRKVLNVRKGKTGARSVPLSDAAVAVFTRIARNKLPAAFLFTRDDGKGWQHSDQDELMREAAKAAKLPKGTVFYTLRHTFIANAIIGGMDLHTVAKITGTSIRMIEEHYGKLLHDDARERLNAIAFA